MADPDAIVAAARAWIGTPYRHQASCQGAGADCLGLIRGVWRTLYGAEPGPVPAYTRDWQEPQGEERLWQAAAEYLRARPPGPVQSGDVLLFRVRSQSVAKHLGIATGPDNFVHAYSGRGVVEAYLSAPWRRRIAARFAFP